MNSIQTTKTSRLVRGIIGWSIPIALIVMGIIIAVVLEFNTHDGIHDTTFMSASLFGGLYLAIPCGLLDIVVGRRALSEDSVNKGIAITGLAIGILGILIGSLSWVSFYMVSMFEF